MLPLSHALNIDAIVRISKGCFLGILGLRVYADLPTGCPTGRGSFENRRTSAREINQRPARFLPIRRPVAQCWATVC